MFFLSIMLFSLEIVVGTFRSLNQLINILLDKSLNLTNLNSFLISVWNNNWQILKIPTSSFFF